jgi:ABC-2 type transport system permease protein
MSPESDMAPAAGRRTRAFYWAVRREIWEHPAIWVAPLAAGGVGLLGFLVSTVSLPQAVSRIAAGAADPKHHNLMHIEGPHSFVALAVLLMGFMAALFYCLAALHNERRDRSIQFWKSLPVSDTTTVLAKVLVPMAVQPLIMLAVIVGAQAIMLAWSTVVVLLNGLDPAVLWSHTPIGTMWPVIAYGLVVNSLWLSAIYGWFLLVGAWAKRAPFVWALGPWLGLALFVRLAFGSWAVLHMLGERLLGGFGEAFSVGGQGKAPIDSVFDLDPLRTLSNPHLWTGLAFAALCIFAAVRLRRTNDPI